MLSSSVQDQASIASKSDFESTTILFSFTFSIDGGGVGGVGVGVDVETDSRILLTGKLADLIGLIIGLIAFLSIFPCKSAYT